MEISESGYGYQCDLNLKATELRLGLPRSDPLQEKHQQSSTSKGSAKRAAAEETPEDSSSRSSTNSSSVSDPRDDGFSVEWLNVHRAQIVGWPPVRSYRKNANLRKIDLKVYKSYPELLEALRGQGW